MSSKFVVEGGLGIPSGSNLELAGTSLSAVSNDPTLADARQNDLVTEYAVKSYVDSKNQFTLSDGVNTTSIDAEETLLTSDDNAMTITVSDNAVAFVIDVDDSSVEKHATNGLQVKALGIATGMLANDAVTGAKIADDAIDSEHITASSIDLAHMSANSVDSDQYVDGSIDLIHMSANSVDSDQYVDGSIDNEHIANATIANGKLVNDSVTVVAGNGLSGGGEVDLGSSVTLDLDLSEADAEVIDNSADSFLFIDATDSSTKKESVADLVAGMDGTGLTAASGSLSVDASQTQVTELGTITTGEWNATKVEGAYIADDTIDSQHYAAGSIDNEHLADDAVDSDEIAAGAIDLAHMSANSVDSDQYVDGSIDLIHMSANSVDSDQYVDGSIDNEHIANATIANGKLVNDSVTVVAGNGLSGGGEVDLGSSVTLDLDLSEADAEVIDNSADSFLFIDATDSSTKKESVADLVAGMDGTGLTAASGSLSVDASQTQVTELGTITTGEWNATKVEGAYIADDTIDSQHYAAGSIDNEHLADDAVDSDEIAAGAIDLAHMSANSVDSDQYVDGSIDLIHMSANSVDSDQYVDGSIDNEHIANATIANGKLVNDSVTVVAGNGLSGGGEVDLGSSVTLDLDLNEATAEVIDNSADSFLFIDATDDSTKKESVADLVAGMDGTGLTAASGSLSVDASQTQITELGTITTGEWNATKVSGSYIADDTIDSNHYAAGSIDNEHLADDAVDSDEIAAGAIDLAHMSANSVDSDQYVDGSIDLIHMSANSVDSDQYVDGSIDNEHIANATIANGKLVNDSVTVTAGNGLSGGGEVDLGSSITLDLDLSEADAEVIDNANDTFLFIDATDSSTKQESIADLVAGMDGTGLTAASGSLSVDATQAQITGIGTSGQMTTFAGTVNVDEAVTMDTTLGVTGVATFTAESVHTGGIDCNGTLSMEGNNIEGTSDDMLIQSGTGLTDYTWSSGTGHMALQSENELVLDSAVRRSSDFAVNANGSQQDMFTFNGTNFHSAKVHVRIGDGTNVTAKELLIVCDESGANPTFVEYATINTETDEAGDPVEQTNTWAVSASGGTISVKCTGDNGDTIKGSFELLKA